MNSNYIRGRSYEYKVKKMLEADGWFVIRSSGSHSVADLVALRLQLNGTYDVKLYQIKTSIHLKKKSEKIVKTETPYGTIDITLLKFPIRKRKRKEKYGK